MLNQFLNKYIIPFKDLKILIIDDDIQLCESLKFYFEDNECIVTTENDGGKGNSRLENEKFDLVFVDLNMPKIDGHMVISNIARNYSETPIIVISGTGDIQSVIRAIQLGAWDFITKPVMDFEVLELSVHRALEKAQLISENREYKSNLEKLVELRTRELEDKAIELEQTNNELNKAKLIAESSDKLKSEFLAQMSHEIRTPVNVILSYMSLIINERDVLDKEEMDQGISVLHQSSKRLIRTIELILNMSEIEIGIFKINKQSVDLIDTIRTLVVEYKTMYRNKNIEILFDSEHKEFLINSDNHSIYHIFSNIIDNAVKYTHEGKVEIKLEECDKFCRVTVNDTGIGISKDYLPRIFDAFSQEEQGYTRSYEGNGLGLSLVKKYCDLNNVRINICSHKYKGTKVELEFPTTTK